MTARYLLDTNICIYIAREKPPEVAARFAALQPGGAAISVITNNGREFRRVGGLRVENWVA